MLDFGVNSVLLNVGSMIMGSYAHFLWETEEEEEEEETERGSIDGVATIAAMVEAF